MSECLFCNIIEGKVPSTKVYEDENVFAFVDIFPMSKEHYLFIHKKHTTNINEVSSQRPEQLVDLFKAIESFTNSNKLSEEGFRVVTNQGKNAGQTVFHTHFHVLGGEKLGSFGI